MRTAAEYDNFRKRSAREKDAAFGDGVAFAVEKLLGVLDTLSLAANTPTQDENYKKGVMMTLEQCAKAFEAIGVEEIEAEGKPFDPQLCAAVMQQGRAGGHGKRHRNAGAAKGLHLQGQGGAPRQCGCGGIGRPTRL